MNRRDPKLTALLFNEYITKHDLDQLVALMAPDHRLVIYGSVDADTAEKSREAWKEFFRLYPDYANTFTRVESRGDVVVMIGTSRCSNEPALRGPAIWSARVRDDLLTEWCVYEDTPKNREELEIA